MESYPKLNIVVLSVRKRIHNIYEGCTEYSLRNSWAEQQTTLLESETRTKTAIDSAIVNCDVHSWKPLTTSELDNNAWTLIQNHLFMV